MKKLKIAFVVVLVVTGASGTYLLNRHSITRSAGGDGTRPGSDTTSKVEDLTFKAGDRNDRPAGIPKRKSFDEKFKATLPSDLNPELAKRLLAEFLAKNADIDEQIHYNIGLMENLCDNGYSNEAWGIVPTESGMLRSWVIKSYFAYADLPSDQLLAKLALAGAETGQGIRGYLFRFGPAEMSAAVSSEGLRAILQDISPEDRKMVHLDQAIRGSLGPQLSDSVNSNFLIISAAAEMNAKGLLDAENFTDLLRRDKTTNAFDKWDRIQAINSSNIRDKEDKEYFLVVRTEFISEMIKENAPGTMDQMLKAGNGYKDHDLASALDSWINIHSSEPSAWFVNNRDNMTPQQQAVAADTFVKKALKAGEFEGARQWAREIPDEARRTKALNAIDAKESGKQKARAGK
jgi:hypothetical protein